MMATYTVYTMDNCPYCTAAKALLERRGLAFTEINVPLDDDAKWDELEKRSGMKTMPQIFKEGALVGGYTELKKSLGA